MKTTTMVKLGFASVYGVMGLANNDSCIGYAIGGYIIGSMGVAIYNKIKKVFGEDEYAKNLKAIKEGTKKPFEINYYNPNITYYYKDLATVFGFTEEEMITILRKYIIKGKYPNVELRNNDWGVYKLNNKGDHVYIEYTAECIEYLKIMLA